MFGNEQCGNHFAKTFTIRTWSSTVFFLSTGLRDVLDSPDVSFEVLVQTLPQHPSPVLPAYPMVGDGDTSARDNRCAISHGFSYFHLSGALAWVHQHRIIMLRRFHVWNTVLCFFFCLVSFYFVLFVITDVKSKSYSLNSHNSR